MAGKDQAGKEHNACVKVFAPNHEIAAELWAEMYDEVSGGFQIASSQWNPRVFVKGPDGRIKALKISAQSMVGYIAEELKI